MSKEFFDAVKAIEAEKGIPAEYLYEKISAAIIVAAKHDYNGKDIVHCDIDPEKQKIKVYVRKNVVDEIERVNFLSTTAKKSDIIDALAA